MPDPCIQLPIEFDVLATFVSAVAGALVAVRRGYDYVGVFALAFVTGLGGALLRDGIFLQTGPAAVVRDSRIILAVLAATLVGAAINQLGRRLTLFVLVFDAVGLGVYAVVGADRSQAAGLGHLGAVLVGVVNAVGGGVLRDVLTREEPVLFKPGQYYGMAAVVAAGVFVGLTACVDGYEPLAAAAGAAAGIAMRLLAVRYDWKTRPLYWKDPKQHRGSVG
ncbi:trimeric intracellular cation channel family protein [Gemmata sp.]|uniref:trimeric intracellular cation channel family protein n=1 Tax=Gemmata sp. TaxID=1914242 RepID=UPI003F707375